MSSLLLLAAAFFTFLPSFFTLDSGHTPTEGIIGGRHVNAGQFPFFVFFKYQMKKDGHVWPSFCGGSLISPRHVLTAAHCVVGMLMDPTPMAMAGSAHRNASESDAQWRKVKRVLVHPQYHNLVNDIAILEVDSPFALNSKVALAKIRRDDLPLLKFPTATLPGFGTYGVLDREPIDSEDLRSVTLWLYPWYYCHQVLAHITSGQICAGGAHIGSGPGDSGGPLVVYSTQGVFQIGLTSSGPIPKEDNGIDLMMHHQDTHPGRRLPVLLRGLRCFSGLHPGRLVL
uniref:Peptidase S1 domain-containing protein n=1 Tax=Steinernema glaseri TaxID=37863 RepID=A0A1I7ZZ47_9BILA